MRPVRMRRFAPPFSDRWKHVGGIFSTGELMRIDPESAARPHPHDEVKIVRALEVHHLSGRRLSDVQQRHGFAEQPFSVLMIGLNRDRAQLYRRIDARWNQCSRAALSRKPRVCWRRAIGAILVR